MTKFFNKMGCSTFRNEKKGLDPKLSNFAKTKKILFITGYFQFRPGGAEYQALLLANRLKTEMEVFFLFRNHMKKPAVIQENGFTLYAIQPYHLKRFNESFILEYRQVYSLLKKIRPDIIYIRGANAYAMAAGRYARKHPCRIIWHTAHDRDVTPFDRGRGFKGLAWVNKIIVEQGLKDAHMIVAQTACQKRLLKKHYHLDASLVVGNWHPVSPSPPEKPAKPVHIIWVANWRPFKRPWMFIRLAAALKHEKGIKFTMIGRHGEYPEWTLAAKQNGIHLTGEISNEKVNQILSESHLLVNTSRMEGFSNTFIQAWMRRVPVISLTVDPDKILVRKKIGRCAGSFEQLVSDTRSLIQDAALRERMGRDARDHATQYHSLYNLERIVPLFKI